jgi:hypothetical protein
MLLTLQQGWRGIELRDFLTSQACVQHVEWDALRYPGAGSPTPPSDTSSGIPLDTPSDTTSGSVGAASRAGDAKRAAGRESGTPGAGDTSQTSQTAAQKRAKSGKSGKSRQKGPARGKSAAKREAASDSTSPPPALISADDTHSEPVQRQADGAMASSSNQRAEL